MKVSLNWLKEWVDIDLDPQAVADRLTLAGLEVEEVLLLGAGLAGIVVAEIIEAEPHPDADRLRVCRVHGDTEERVIVCGAPNAAVGLKAPLATLGTVMPNGMEIKRAKLRGVASEGMLCSASELQLSDGEDAASGLMALPADAPVGMALVDYLRLDDAIIDIDLTPNRADCLSIRGVARELSALTGASFHEPEFAPVSAVVEDQVAVSLQAAKDCPHYVSRVIRGVDVSATTPAWMVERLRRLGIRSLGPIVDVTNYVLLELGQPMHAFDLAKIKEGIQIRRALAAEQIKLLDGQTIELDESCLVIADASGVIALAGIMGGLESAVSDHTQDIVLESAWFSPPSVAGRGRRYGISTESSHRFERGVDPSLQVKAIERATELILQMAGGRPGPVVQTISETDLPGEVTIALKVAEINRLLGTDLDQAKVESILLALGMRVDTGQDDVLHITPPTARRDIVQPVDVIEEVARIVGYDQLPTQPPSGLIDLHMPPEAAVPSARLRSHLVSRGFQELLTWSFISEATCQVDGTPLTGLALANPLTQEHGLMRPMLLPGLLDVARRNVRYGQPDQRLFEVGHCFDQDTEFECVGLLMLGRQSPEHFDAAARPVDFFDLKGEVEHLFATLNLGTPEFDAGTAHDWLHPAQAATISLGGRVVGYLGRLHPVIADRYDLKRDCMVAQLQWEPISTALLPVHRSQSKYQASRRDLAIVLGEAIEAKAVLAVIREAAGSQLEDCILFDQYQGPGVEKGCKSLAIGLIIRDNSRTLTDSELDELSSTVLGRLRDAFNAKLRGKES